MICADATFRRNFLGQGIRVGVLDSGVNPHPFFGERLLSGHNYIPDAEDPEDTSDSYGHGTGVAGLIAAAGGEGGYLGAAPGAEIVPLKVTDGKIVKVSAICDAIYGAVDDFDCRVLNLSMGVDTDYQSLREAVAYAEGKNVIVVSAVGNDGGTELYYPAAYDSVIGVGAVDRSGMYSSTSGHNASVFLTAPGEQVRTTSSLGGYTDCSGTSFAVAQVAGAAAVMLGIDSSLTPGALREILAKTAADRGEAGFDDYYGYGILNIGGCVAALTEPERTPCFYGDDCPLRAFSDLDCGAWYHDALRYVLSESIMNGLDGCVFAPDEPVTREALVTILYRYRQAKGGSAADSEDFRLDFPDAGDVSDWAVEAMRWITAPGIMQGTDSGMLLPRAAATRAQIAAILLRVRSARTS